MNRRQFCLASTSALALGGFSATIASAQTGDPMTGDDPMLAAEYLSSLESNQYIPTLYALYSYIHPDAAAVVPRSTVIGWYQADFHPKGPRPAVATGVTWLDSWTWNVTGQTYANVAKVSFVQEFENGETLNDVVRLTFYDGFWRWWFGRDADWVDEQISRFSLIEHTPQAGDAPFGLSALTGLDASLLDKLPASIADATFGKTYTLEPTAGSFNPDGIREPHTRLLYKPTEPPLEFGLGSVEHGAIVDSTSDADDLMRFADQAQNAPPVEFVGWNAIPTAGPAWLQVLNAGVDVVGDSYAIYLVMDGAYLLIRMFTEEALATVCEALTT